MLLAGLSGGLTAQDVERNELVVRELSFHGNRAIDDLVLRASIATTHSSVFARSPFLRWTGLGEKRYFNETQFRTDVFRIMALYGRSGYREVHVDTLVRRSNGDVYVSFFIDEGEPVRVESLTVSGLEGIIDSETVVQTLPLRQGDPFNLLLLQASVDSIETILGNEGYPFPEVFQNFNVDLENHAAQVSWEVVPGDAAVFGEVEVTGTNEVSEGVVRRALSFKPGQPYREQKLRQSQADIYRLNLFNFVGIGLADSLPPEPEDSSVAVSVRVTEANLRRVRLGGGYGTIDCFRVLGAWTIFDFLGGGRTLDLAARFSKIGVGDPIDLGLTNGICLGLRDEDTSRLKLNYNLAVSLREPFFLSRRTSAGITFGAERYTEYQAYLQEYIGAEVSVTWRIPGEIPLTGSYQLSQAKTEADPATFCEFLDVCLVEDTRIFQQRRPRATLGWGVVFDRTDSPTAALRGIRITGEFRHASDNIGSDSLIQFTRGIGEFASFHQLGQRSVFAWRVRIGAVAPLKTTYVSPEDRLYGGGPNSVRGYGRNELGPLVRVLERIETSGERVDSIIRRSATGGDRLLIITSEVRFPLPSFGQRIAGAVFLDAGQVIDHGKSSERLTDLKITPGIGFRVATALGPMRLDVGFNPYEPRASVLYVEEDGLLVSVDDNYTPRVEGFLSRLRLHFSVGHAF